MVKVVNLLHSWGSMVAIYSDGGMDSYRDCVIGYRGPFGMKTDHLTMTRWDWNQTGTHHKPGIQIADLELLGGGKYLTDLPFKTTIYLSLGVDGVLECPEATIKHIKNRGFEVVVERTPELVRLFNEALLTGKPAVGLFHSTC